MPRRLLFLLLLMVAVLRPVLAEGPAGVALIADLAGPARVEIDRAEREARLLHRLPAGAVLRVPPGSRATLFYPGSGTAFDLRDGRYLVDAGEVRGLDGVPTPTGRALAAAFRGVRLDRVHITQAGVVMRAAGADARPQPLGPEGLLLSTGQVVFRWSAATPAGAYRFRLTDAAGEPLHETTTRETELPLPADVVLPAGRRLMWSVQAAGRLSPVRWATLIVADPATRDLAAALDRSGQAESEAERNLRVLLLTQHALPSE